MSCVVWQDILHMHGIFLSHFLGSRLKICQAISLTSVLTSSEYQVTDKHLRGGWILGLSVSNLKPELR